MNHEDTLTRMRLANPADTADPDEMASLRASITAQSAAPSSRRLVPKLRWQPHPAFVAVVALVVILALFLPLRYVGQRDEPGDAAATGPPPSGVAPTISAPSSAPPAAPVLPFSVDPTQLRWRRVNMPGLSGGDVFFDSVITGGPGLIAVGSPYRSGAFIWTSEDGVDWTAASVDMPGYAFDVIAGGPGYVAVGTSIWISSDGVSWNEAAWEDPYPIYEELRAVTVGGPGMVAVGIFNIYTSTDGIRWSAIPQDGAPEPDTDGGMTDIVAGGPGLVAVGHYGDVGIVWTSTDGFEWSRVPRDRAVFGYGDTEILSVATDDSQLIAVGRIAVDRNTNYDTMGVWASPDGISWSVVPLDDTDFNEGDVLRSIISTEQGFIAGGRADDGEAAVWYSPDGASWTRLATAGVLGGHDSQVVNDLSVLDNKLIAVGWEADPNYEDEALWYESEAVWIGEFVEE